MSPAELSFQKGWFEVQDEGSQIVADLALPGEGEQVLDYCAGGGGKTLAMAATMQNKGQIHAYDFRPQAACPDHRAAEACRNPAMCRCMIRKAALDSLLGKLDRVLVDAPCTGTGDLAPSPPTPNGG